jgi:AcrR family transcriptional regulator
VRTSSQREPILERAVQLASVHGLNGLTIGTLAEHVGMSKGGISAHFKSKTALQLEVVTKASQLMIEHVISPARKKPAGLARLKAFDAAWWKYLENRVFEGGCFFINAILELDDMTDNEVAAAVQSQYQRLISYLEAETKIAKKQAELQTDLNVSSFVLEFMALRFGAIVYRSLGIQNGVPLAKKAVKALIARVSI